MYALEGKVKSEHHADIHMLKPERTESFAQKLRTIRESAESAFSSGRFRLATNNHEVGYPSTNGGGGRGLTGRPRGKSMETRTHTLRDVGYTCREE